MYNLNLQFPFFIKQFHFFHFLIRIISLNTLNIKTTNSVTQLHFAIFNWLPHHRLFLLYLKFGQMEFKKLVLNVASSKQINNKSITMKILSLKAAIFLLLMTLINSLNRINNIYLIKLCLILNKYNFTFRIRRL
jgi:hypothetical protein